MINEDQEDEIRNLLTLIVFYFQIIDDGTNERKKQIETQKELCQGSANKVVSMLSQYGNGNHTEKKLLRLANIILDKLGYEKDGRDTFITNCINQLK